MDSRFKHSGMTSLNPSFFGFSKVRVVLEELYELCSRKTCSSHARNSSLFLREEYKVSSFESLRMSGLFYC